ncbi:MAG: DUF4880 domain-containing protein [Rhodospirillales bacterium]|nr:DUF4880 domain-containing protein [Rhodospirillales bacterium]
MAMTSDSEDRRAAAKEATGWLIALREEPDDGALRARFDAWLVASPANQTAWSETRHVDELIGRARPALGAHAQPTPVDLGSARRRWRPRRLAVAAAAFAIAACVLLVFTPGILLWFQAAHTTSTAELRLLRLEDGSVVQLGPASAIDMTFVPAERRVRLLKGEAFFEVVRDAARPFIVESGDVRTTVLGTSFEVRLSSEGTDVAVRSGLVRVAVDGPGPPVSEQLAAGDRLRIGSVGQVERSRGAPDEAAAWLQGQIVARDRSVADIVDELGRYHRGTILIADDTLARERVTGVYNLADPRAALRAVASAHGATVREITPWLTVFSRN